MNNLEHIYDNDNDNDSMWYMAYSRETENKYDKNHGKIDK